MSRLYARVVVWLRWPLALAVVAGAVAAGTQLPTLDSQSHGSLGNLVPPGSHAIKTEQDASRRLGVPILSRTLLVQRDARGLPQAEQAAIVRRARDAKLTGAGEVVGAAPFVNRPGLLPHDRRPGTTAITGLIFSPGLDEFDQPQAARDWVARNRPTHAVGVTGSIPAQVAQGTLVDDRLPLVEAATALLVTLLVGLYFRSLAAPLLTLAAVGVAYVLTDRMLAQLAIGQDVSIPQEVHPVIVVLLFGVVTDYTVFYLSRARALMQEGRPRLAAAREATASITGIVTTAAVTVAGASLALYASGLSFLRAFGPGMAGAVLIAWLVVVLVVPISLAIFGRLLFWPSVGTAPATATPVPDAAPRGSLLVRLAVGHPIVASVLCLALLGGAVSGVAHLRLGNPLIASLPKDTQERRAYDAISDSVGPGVAAPTIVLLHRTGLDRRPARVASFQRWLEEQPGVASVLGPGDLGLAGPRRIALDGAEARFVLLFADDPLGGRAVNALRRIERDAPGALSARGLPGARAAFAGDTAVTAEMVHATLADLLRIGAIVLLVLFVVLALYLRALVAPLYLLGSSVLALLAALGLGTYIFQDLLGYDGLSYFTLVTTGVLLVALGSDYNVFLVGDVWREAKRRPSREAITLAASRTSKPITVAGLILALSFALLAIVPVTLFREIAVVMCLGLLLDAFLVRTLLVPALLSLFGSLGSWPGGRLQRHRPGAVRRFPGEPVGPLQADPPT